MKNSTIKHNMTLKFVLLVNNGDASKKTSACGISDPILRSKLCELFFWLYILKTLKVEIYTFLDQCLPRSKSKLLYYFLVAFVWSKVLLYFGEHWNGIQCWPFPLTAIDQSVHPIRGREKQICFSSLFHKIEVGEYQGCTPCI